MASQITRRPHPCAAASTAVSSATPSPRPWPSRSAPAAAKPSLHRGRALLVYADPAHERCGAGGRYVFLLREQAPSANPEDGLGFGLSAADALP